MIYLIEDEFDENVDEIQEDDLTLEETAMLAEEFLANYYELQEMSLRKLSVLHNKNPNAVKSKFSPRMRHKLIGSAERFAKNGKGRRFVSDPSLI